jgi:sRNA-binding carbon storage regulator CsrA
MLIFDKEEGREIYILSNDGEHIGTIVSLGGVGNRVKIGLDSPQRVIHFVSRESYEQNGFKPRKGSNDGTV